MAYDTHGDSDEPKKMRRIDRSAPPPARIQRGPWHASIPTE
jgi:hypothetical protein